MQNEPVVELKGISKSFPGVKALDSVSFSVDIGGVYGLVGENGAGKSTLMKILSGSYQYDEGEIRFEGKPVQFRNEREALDIGISIVPQELSYFPELTIEENIYIGREPEHIGFLDKKGRHTKVTELIQSLNLSFDPRTKMRELSIAQCQLIEIIKAISRNAKVVIMDEPTSSLTTVETKQLFLQIQALKDSGKSVIYISHKLEEILALCDSITVLRDSKYIGSLSREEATETKLISMMVGREMGKLYPPVGEVVGEEVLRVENLSEPGLFSDISFSVHAGEVVGFSGMVGAGRSEVMRAIFGIDNYSEGTIYVGGEKVRINSTQESTALGMGMVTEDRAAYGFVPDLSVLNNVSLPNAKDFSNGIFLNKKRMRVETETIKEKIRIRTPNLDTSVKFLSGGNQQKVVLAKWLVRNIKILIMDEPTRGIDVGAKQEIYQLIATLAAQGMAVIVVSSEMPEVIGLSKRIFVMDGGRILKEFSHQEVTQDLIMETIIEGGRNL